MKEYLKSKEIKAHGFDVIVVGCGPVAVSYTHLRALATSQNRVGRGLLV